jgi:hypothetical protein
MRPARGQRVKSHLRLLGHQQQPDQDARRKEDRGAFGENADAEGDPDGEPLGAAASLMKFGEREQKKRRRDHHRIIRRR